MIHADDIPQLKLHRIARDIRLLGGNRHLKKGLKAEALRRMASFTFRSLIDLTLATGKTEIIDPHSVLDMVYNREGVIGAIWHDRLLLALLGFRELFGRSSTSHRCRAMISESGDGELVARLFRDMGGNCVRGSRSRSASDALRGGLEELQRGNTLIVTPDGPRGPRHDLKDGIIHLASVSGRPIVPVSGSFGRSLRLRRSWDQFRISLPFGRIQVAFGKPIFVQPNLSVEAVATVRSEVAQAMRELTDKMEAQDGRVYSVGKPRKAAPQD